MNTYRIKIKTWDGEIEEITVKSHSILGAIGQVEDKGVFLDAVFVGRNKL